MDDTWSQCSAAEWVAAMLEGVCLRATGVTPKSESKGYDGREFSRGKGTRPSNHASSFNAACIVGRTVCASIFGSSLFSVE